MKELKPVIEFDIFQRAYKIHAPESGMVVAGIKAWAKEHGAVVDDSISFIHGIDRVLKEEHMVIVGAYVTSGELVLNGLNYVREKYHCQAGLVDGLKAELSAAGKLEEETKPELQLFHEALTQFSEKPGDPASR